MKKLIRLVYHQGDPIERSNDMEFLHLEDHDGVLIVWYAVPSNFDVDACFARLREAAAK